MAATGEATVDAGKSHCESHRDPWSSPSVHGTSDASGGSLSQGLTAVPDAKTAGFTDDFSPTTMVHRCGLPSSRIRLSPVLHDCDANVQVESDKTISENFTEMWTVDQQYLKRLESKLAALKNPKSYRQREIMLKQLSEHSRCLFDSSSYSAMVDDTEEHISTNPVYKRLFPESTALTKEEIARLLENDVLSKTSDLFFSTLPNSS